MPPRRRERELARARMARRAARRAAARRRRQRIALSAAAGVAVLVVIVAVALAVRGGGSSSTPSAASTAPACSPVPTAKPRTETFAHEPKLTIARTTYTATLTTNCGTITLTLNGKAAPHTVNSFAFLAGKKYFDDTICHRVTTKGIYVLQCGDPTGTGTGGPGYTIPDENLKGATYPAGTVAMANTGKKHSGGSQFFLVYKDTDLPASYTPFGTVTGGLSVIKKVAAAGATPAGDGTPKQPITIETFRVTKG